MLAGLRLGLSEQGQAECRLVPGVAKYLESISFYNYPLGINVSRQDYGQRIEAVQSARQEAPQVMYERALRALRAKAKREELVQPYKFDEGEWVLVRNEDLRKFESK